MVAATRFGINWAKIPTEQEHGKAIAQSKDGHPDWLFPLVYFVSSTGVRICEAMHARCEHVLPGNMFVLARRKKKTRKEEVVDLFPEFAEWLYEYVKGRTGWLFPGSAAPCVIMRRPQFLETACPDCGRQLVRLDQIRKKCDRVTHFATHLQQEHSRTPDEIQEWIEFASKEVRDQCCDGGHLHLRTAQTRFRMLMMQIGAYVPGRGIHSLRHAFAIKLWKETKDLMLVKQMLGHENVTTTQVYATAVDTREKLQKIGRAVAA